MLTNNPITIRHILYWISSIKIFEKSIKTPRVVSMYCTGSSPRFWIWLSFFECFGILSASLLSIFWVLSSKYFGFNAAEERSLLEICIYSISKFPLFIIRLVHILWNCLGIFTKLKDGRTTTCEYLSTSLCCTTEQSLF